MSDERQYIVSATHQRAMDYAKEHQISNSQVVILHTGNRTATLGLRGKILSRDQVHYVDGWDDGKYAMQVQADIVTMLSADR